MSTGGGVPTSAGGELDGTVDTLFVDGFEESDLLMAGPDDPGGYWQWSSSSKYQVSGIAYDRNGNILALQRRNGSGTLIDNLTYVYGQKSNRLTSISDGAGTSSEIWDVESGAAFGYNFNGSRKREAIVESRG